MQTEVFLVRHAHAVFNADEQGRPLSEKGCADAHKVAAIINEYQVDHIYTSPYKRAIQTVEGIALYQNKEIRIEEDFKERKLADKPVADFDGAVRKVWENPQFNWKGGESNIEAQNRGVKAMRRLLKRHEGERIVIGLHGNIMVLIMQYFDEKYGFDFWKKLAMPDIYQLCFQGETLIGVKRCW